MGSGAGHGWVGAGGLDLKQTFLYRALASHQHSSALEKTNAQGI